MKRRSLPLLLVLSLFVAGILAAPAPASAASYVTGCFRYVKGGSIEGLTAQLQAQYLGNWYLISTHPLPLSGCVVWNLSATYQSYPMRIVVNDRAAGALWSGTAPGVAPPGNGRWNVGTGVVYCLGCAAY
jgi:hypothetical protein